VVNPAARQEATDLMWAIYEALDPLSRSDVQLVDAAVSITADDKVLDKVRAAAEKAGAQWREEADHF
jgi:hypothetical protein